jgi:hypothetical protein
MLEELKTRIREEILDISQENVLKAFSALLNLLKPSGNFTYDQV